MDDKKQVLDASRNHGVVDWMSPESGETTGRLMITSRSTMMARNFSCGSFTVVCGMVIGIFSPYNCTIAIGQEAALYAANPQFCDSYSPQQCYGNQVSSGGASVFSEAGGPGVIKLSDQYQQYSLSPNLTGVGVGAGSVYIQVTAGQCQSSGTGSPNVTPAFQISYSSYIPVDHATVPTGCTYNGNTTNYIYLGDANRGTSRTAQGILITPSLSTVSGYYGTCGQTRQYAYGSPANGSTISSLDEDNVSGDCYHWNASGTASSSSWSHTETYSSTQGQELLIGSAGNPLESSAGPITWNMRVVTDTSKPSSPTAYVNYNHTCYPAHQVFVNGTQVYLYTPSLNSFAYIATCLSGISSSKVTGQTSAVAVPTH